VVLVVSDCGGTTIGVAVGGKLVGKGVGDLVVHIIVVVYSSSSSSVVLGISVVSDCGGTTIGGKVGDFEGDLVVQTIVVLVVSSCGGTTIGVAVGDLVVHVMVVVYSSSSVVLGVSVVSD